jgi:hypothetical protein
MECCVKKIGVFVKREISSCDSKKKKKRMMWKVEKKPGSHTDLTWGRFLHDAAVVAGAS